MQIVSKWHNIGATQHTTTRRIERLSRASKAKTNRPEVRSQKPLAAVSFGIDGHSLIATQVVATRFADAFDLSYEASNSIAGAEAYGAALDRKIHRMDHGSFYQEAL
ncbi:MAG: hypothetical protein ABJN24_00565 [Hyphomicrobiales bacterium]